ELESATGKNSTYEGSGQNLVSLNDLVASRSGMKKYLETIVSCYNNDFLDADIYALPCSKAKIFSNAILK
ncbi:hypothetical protein AB6D02_21760, partial [Vibrio splendidus]